MASFKSLRKTRQTKMTVNAGPETVFSLLCPIREYDWIEVWACEMIFSQSGVAEDNCVFATDLPDRGGAEVWTVSRYEPGRCIEFVRFSIGEKILKLDIWLSALGRDQTEVLWRKTFTGLSEAGNRVVADLTGEHFDLETEMIEKMLNHYLETGQRLSIS